MTKQHYIELYYNGTVLTLWCQKQMLVGAAEDQNLHRVV